MNLPLEPDASALAAALQSGRAVCRPTEPPRSLAGTAMQGRPYLLLLTSSAAGIRLSPAHELLSGAFVPAILGGPTQWLVSDLSPTVRNCPATTCACHSGSRVTARIVRHWSQRNWRTGTVVCDISSRARSGTTIILGTASHFGHLPFKVISGPQHSSRVIWPLRNLPTHRCSIIVPAAPLISDHIPAALTTATGSRSALAPGLSPSTRPLTLNCASHLRSRSLQIRVLRNTWSR